MAFLAGRGTQLLPFAARYPRELDRAQRVPAEAVSPFGGVLAGAKDESRLVGGELDLDPHEAIVGVFDAQPSAALDVPPLGPRLNAPIEPAGTLEL